MSLKNCWECERVKIISETFINFVHFGRSIALGYHSIQKVSWGSFRDRCEKNRGSFRGRVHFGGCYRSFGSDINLDLTEFDRYWHCNVNSLPIDSRTLSLDPGGSSRLYLKDLCLQRRLHRFCWYSCLQTPVIHSHVCRNSHSASTLSGSIHRFYDMAKPLSSTGSFSVSSAGKLAVDKPR